MARAFVKWGSVKTNSNQELEGGSERLMVGCVVVTSESVFTIKSLA